MNEDKFYSQVARALSGCQLVEQQLKLYITEALNLARKCIDGKMPFKLNGDDYEDSSLERLIETFKKLSSNEVLSRDLVAFKKERNFLSHKAITHCLDYEGELLDPAAEDMQARLLAISKEAGRLCGAIHLEANKFRGHLYFDPLPD